MPGGSENGGGAKAGRRKKLKKVKDFVLGDVLGEGEKSHDQITPEKCAEPTPSLLKSSDFVQRACCGRKIPGMCCDVGDAAGAYGQVREGLRVKEPKFGQRVAVKIMSRKLLRKVC
jgi:hypothetical protein